MKNLITTLAFILMAFNTQAQVMPELSQYLNGQADAEIVTVNITNSRYTSYGKCTLFRRGDKLMGNYSQAFSDRNVFQGDKDNMGIEIDLKTGIVTMIINSWGGNRETYNTIVQSNGKLLVATSNDRSVIVSLAKR